MSQTMIDETHDGLQKLYFVCLTRPTRPLAELEERAAIGFPELPDLHVRRRLASPDAIQESL